MPPKRTRLQSTSRLWSFVPLDIWELVIPVCLFVETLQYVAPARQLPCPLISILCPCPSQIQPSFFLSFLTVLWAHWDPPFWINLQRGPQPIRCILFPLPLYCHPFKRRLLILMAPRLSTLLLPERKLLPTITPSPLCKNPSPSGPVLCGSAFMSHSILLLIPFPLRKMWFLAQPAEMH